MISFSTGKLRKKNLFKTNNSNNKFKLRKNSKANWWKHLMNSLTVKGIPSRMLLYRYNFSTRRRLHRIVKGIFVIQKQSCKSIKSRQSRSVIAEIFRRDKVYVVGVICPPLIVIGLMYLNILVMRLTLPLITPLQYNKLFYAKILFRGATKIE